MSIQDETKSMLVQEMDNRDWHINDYRAGLAAIVGGESNFIPKYELGYSRTANARIRLIFRSRAGNLSDDELNQIKSTDESWFNFIYGSQFEDITHLGNTEPDDGYKFRGGGLIQLTGRSNYAHFGPKVGVDLIAHPDLINTPRIAAAVAVEYIKERFHGGSFNDMKAAVGYSVGNPNDVKNELYREYKQTGEWDYKPGAVPVPVIPPVVVVPDSGSPPNDGPKIDPVVTDFISTLQNLEKFFQNSGLYTGPIDNDPGPGIRAALKEYLQSIG